MPLRFRGNPLDLFSAAHGAQEVSTAHPALEGHRDLARELLARHRVNIEHYRLLREANPSKGRYAGSEE